MHDFSALAAEIDASLSDPDCPPTSGPLPPAWVDALEARIPHALRHFARTPYEAKHALLRAYRGTALDFALNEAVLTSAEDPMSALRRAGAGEAITLQFSDINRWDDEITRLFAPLRAILPPALSFFANDFRIGLFIGTGGHTPFGVHADGLDRTLLHVPLLGTGKRMHFQSSASFERRHGHMRPTLDVAGCLPHMQAIEMRRGRFVFFRGDWFHLGTYAGLSMSLILNIKRNGARNLRGRLRAAAPVEPVVDRLCGRGGGEPMEADWIDRAAGRLVADLESAGGFLGPLPVRARADGAVRRVAPFPIRYREEDTGRHRLHARGEGLGLPPDAATREAVRGLNQGEAVPLRALAATAGRAREVATFLLRVGAVR